jgi:hypothetical protein
MLLLLSRCRFASECHMKIKVEEASLDHIGVLRPFFHAHKILSLRVEMPPASLSVLSTEIMQISSVEFDGVVPSLEMMQTRPLSDTITIQNLNVDDENEAKLWELLPSYARALTCSQSPPHSGFAAARNRTGIGWIGPRGMQALLGSYFRGL